MPTITRRAHVDANFTRPPSLGSFFTLLHKGKNSGEWPCLMFEGVSCSWNQGRDNPDAQRFSPLPEIVPIPDTERCTLGLPK